MLVWRSWVAGMRPIGMQTKVFAPRTQVTGPGALSELRIDLSLVHLGALASTLVIGVASFAVSMQTGLLITALVSLGLVAVAPALAPMLVFAGFLFQNLLTAAFTPIVQNARALDVLRGTNFVILIAAFGMLIAVAFLAPGRLPRPTRTWLHAILLLAAMITFYFFLGLATGSAKDALVYLRNTITPVLTFAVGLLAASLYRVAFERLLLLMGALALLFGYCELVFQLDFLALFNGDDFYAARIAEALENNGELGTRLTRPGELYPGLQGLLTVPLFNLTFLNDFVPQLFRLSGPNFHPISYAYVIAILACWRLFSGRWGFLVAALPILIAVGSKGAIMVVLASVVMRVCLTLFGARVAISTTALMLIGYTTLAIVVGYANRDYHVIGFVSGIRFFLDNPIGRGLGQGGNLSGTAMAMIDWPKAQAQGYTDVPVESTLSVMLYQMGLATAAFYGWLFLIIRRCLRLRGDGFPPVRYFPAAVISAIAANSVLQEEAVYSPLGLGFCLLIVGMFMGTHFRRRQRLQKDPPEVAKRQAVTDPRVPTAQWDRSSQDRFDLAGSQTHHQAPSKSRRHLFLRQPHERP